MSTLFGKKRKIGLVSRTTTSMIDDCGGANDSTRMMATSERPPPNQNIMMDSHVVVPATTFQDMGLVEPLVAMCQQLSWKVPTPVQQTMIPYLLQHRTPPCLVLSATGSGKTASYLLPILHHCSFDPYMVYAIIVTPTRELAQQIHQQVLVLGSATYNIQSMCIVGGYDIVQQANTLIHHPPHIIVATPGRLATILRNPCPPRNLHKVAYLVLDEADRLLVSSTVSSSSSNHHRSSHRNHSCGFTADIAEILLHVHPSVTTTTTTHPRRTTKCQTLLFSATCTSSLETLQNLALGDSQNRSPSSSSLRKFVISQDYQAAGAAEEESPTVPASTTTPQHDSPTTKATPTAISVIPNGLKQEYVFMPDRVRDAYLLATVRTLLANGGQPQPSTTTNGRDTAGVTRKSKQNHHRPHKKSGGYNNNSRSLASTTTAMTSPNNVTDDTTPTEVYKAQSAILFVATCERAAFVSGLLDQVGVSNVALHSLLSQPRRVAALGKFQSEVVRVMVATDIASRGLDIPRTDLVINVELPRNPINYIHRVGRTARAGRRGRAISLVAECDITLVETIERVVGRPLELCTDVTDDIAITMLGPASKAARLTKLKLADINFHELVQKMKERKVRDRKERQRREQLQQRQIQDS
jgi:superfamily II DNA/RNA helicase